MRVMKMQTILIICTNAQDLSFKFIHFKRLNAQKTTSAERVLSIKENRHGPSQKTQKQKVIIYNVEMILSHILLEFLLEVQILLL